MLGKFTFAPRKLLVFARAPISGRCKTRLAPRYGAHGAASIHQNLVLKTLRTAQATAAITELWCEPDSRHGFFNACRRHHPLILQRQPRGDLGRKMSLALSRSLTRARSVVIIGTDCAALSSRDIEQAFQALEQGMDCVIKPAADGGYVLIGARRSIAPALRNIDWSSGRELRQTLHRLRRQGFAVQTLETSWDVDHPRDVIRARRNGLL